MLFEDEERRNKLVELMWMGMDGPEDDSESVSLSSLVSLCKDPSVQDVQEHCWDMIVNDRGVCYTLKKGPDKKSRITHKEKLLLKSTF